MNDPWSKEDSDLTVRLWADGLSASMIGERVGRNRSAVCGFMNRNRERFPFRRAPRLPAAPVPPKVRRSPFPRQTSVVVRTELASVPLVEEIDLDFQPQNPIRFVDVANGRCRWPLWPAEENPGAYGLCCGEATAEGSSWCRHHKARSAQEKKAA